MKKVIGSFAASMVLVCCAHASEVYKWTDADGKVHFSTRPPTEKPATVEVKKYRNLSPSSYQMTDEDKQDWVNAYKAELSKVDESNNALNCSSAMSNTNYQFETMLAQGVRNIENGSITEAQYEHARSSIEKARSFISYSGCQSATGVERSFYECMSNDSNHLLGCGEKYNFFDL